MVVSIDPNTNIAKREIVEKLKTANYFIFKEFANQQVFHDAVKQIFLEGIEQIESKSCRREVEKSGLCRMHEYFPADKVGYLDIFVRENIKNIVTKMVYSFCSNELNYSEEFFIDRRYVLKISYPFKVAVKSKFSYKQYTEYLQQMEQPQTGGFDLKSVALEAKKIIKKALKKNHSNSESFKRSDVKYHEMYPYAANAFGPHIDSWYGSSLNELNLWWSIEGVKEDNGVILYPELFGEYIEYNKQFAYLPPGITLPKPHKIEIPDGSVLVFNSDILHGSHLNVSDVTRIIIAPRVVLHKPKFNPNYQSLQSQKWYSSEDIARGEFNKIVEFPMEKNLGVLYEGMQKPHVEKRIAIAVNSPLLEGVPIALCASDTLGVGEKMLVNLQKESVIVLRTAKKLQAVSALCPHLKINLIDGFHDEQHIYCPGHGVTFCLSDGTSKCDLLKLRVYKADDRDGQIWLTKS